MIEKIEEFLEETVDRVHAKLSTTMKYRDLMENLAVLEKVSVIKRNLDLRDEDDDYEDEETEVLSNEELAGGLSGHKKK